MVIQCFYLFEIKLFDITKFIRAIRARDKKRVTSKHSAQQTTFRDV